MMHNPPGTFEGRKVGIVISDGVDAAVLKSLQTAIVNAGATFEIIAPRVGGAIASNGTQLEAQQRIDGAPSVLYDAVALLLSEDATKKLAANPALRDFISDAAVHKKFIGYGDAAEPLLKRVLGIPKTDAGMFGLGNAASAKAFVEACAELRYWKRK